MNLGVIGARLHDNRSHLRVRMLYHEPIKYQEYTRHPITRPVNGSHLRVMMPYYEHVIQQVVRIPSEELWDTIYNALDDFTNDMTAYLRFLAVSVYSRNMQVKLFNLAS